MSMADTRARRRWGAVLLALLFLAPIFFSATPVPAIRPCLNDLAGVVAPADAVAIRAICDRVERNSTVEIGILVVNSTQPADIDTYAADVFQKSGIGQKGQDNGLLLVIATADRTWRVEVGYGLEPVLPDGKVGTIARAYLLPSLKAGLYGQGILDTLSQFESAIQSDYVPGKRVSRDPPWLCIGAFVLVFLVVIVLFIKFGVRFRGPPKSGFESGRYSPPYNRGRRGGFGGSSGGGFSSGGSFGGGRSGGGGASGSF